MVSGWGRRIKRAGGAEGLRALYCPACPSGGYFTEQP
jgi:hypothetical protein